MTADAAPETPELADRVAALEGVAAKLDTRTLNLQSEQRLQRKRSERTRRAVDRLRRHLWWMAVLVPVGTGAAMAAAVALLG